MFLNITLQSEKKYKSEGGGEVMIINYVVNPVEYAEAVRRQVLVGNEFNIFTHSVELHSYIEECVSGCGQMTTIREHFNDIVYSISWFQFDVEIKGDAIFFIPNHKVLSINCLQYKGLRVNCVQIRRPIYE